MVAGTEFRAGRVRACNREYAHGVGYYFAYAFSTDSLQHLWSRNDAVSSNIVGAYFPCTA